MASKTLNKPINPPAKGLKPGQKGDALSNAPAEPESTVPAIVVEAVPENSPEGQSQEAQAEAKKAKKPPPPARKRDSDDDFEPLDPELQAYVGGFDTDAGATGGGWASLLEEDKPKVEEIEEEDEDDEEEDEEEDSDDILSEEEILEPPFTWHPSEEGFKESDLASRKKRRYVLGTHSFLELTNPALEDALEPGNLDDENMSKAEKARKGLKGERDMYKDLCKQAGIAPNAIFLAALGTGVLDLSNHGLTEKEVEAICKTLFDDTHIKVCKLSGNAAGLDGGLAMAGMIENNYTMEQLDIANTEIVEAFDAICEAISLNISLTLLDLSKNELGDEEMMFVGNLLADNSSIQQLFLGKNMIKDAGLAEIGSGLDENKTLILLDLSNNRIRGAKKASIFFAACAEHPQLRHLDLHKNLIRNEGAKGIGRVLAKNDRIQYLDLSFNIMEEAAGVPLGRGLNIGPRELEKLHLEQQWWHQKAATAVLKPFGNPNNQMPIELIDFGFLMDIHTPFIKARDKAKKLYPELEIIHGQTYGLNKSESPDPKALVIRRANIVCENFETPLVMLMEELAKEPKKISAQDFKKFIKQCNLYKDKTLTEAFEKVFPSGNFDVDSEAILEAFDKEYPGLRVIPEPVPEEEPKPEAPKKEKKKKGQGKGKGSKGKTKPAKGAAAKPKSKKKK